MRSRIAAPRPPISMLRWEARRIASGRTKVLRSHAFIKCVSLLENRRVVSLAHTAVSFLRHQRGPVFAKQTPDGLTRALSRQLCRRTRGWSPRRRLPPCPPNFNIEIGGRGGAAVFRKMPARLAGVYFASTGGEFPSSIVIFVLGHIPTPFCHRLPPQFGPLYSSKKLPASPLTPFCNTPAPDMPQLSKSEQTRCLVLQG